MSKQQMHHSLHVTIDETMKISSPTMLSLQSKLFTSMWLTRSVASISAFEHVECVGFES